MADDPLGSHAEATVSKRSLLGSIAALVGSGLTGAAALAASSGPAAAVDGDPAAFEVGEHPTVTSNDGRVESVYLSPEIDVSWTDFGAGVETVTLSLAVGSEAGVDPVYTETLRADEPTATPGDVTSVAGGGDGGRAPPDFDAVDGAVSVAFDRVDATERGDAVTSETLSAPDLAGGETATTTLDVVVRADVSGGDDEATVVRTTTAELTVDNPAGDADAGGEVIVDAA
ncbi:hypothetical protein [Halorubrum sp. DTA98]|uniref:hypothetical protein n=1 Tax=Halorubrum sp. DTA98 TaxID=3402163 RepID=UPI003AB042D7